jgi:hypothetical protein
MQVHTGNVLAAKALEDARRQFPTDTVNGDKGHNSFRLSTQLRTFHFERMFVKSLMPKCTRPQVLLFSKWSNKTLLSSSQINSPAQRFAGS